MQQYHVYQNWQANGMRYKVHAADCGFCQNGAGAHPNAVVGLNGVWIGPFATIPLTEAYRERMGIPFEQ